MTYRYSGDLPVPARILAFALVALHRRTVSTATEILGEEANNEGKV